MKPSTNERRENHRAEIKDAGYNNQINADKNFHYRTHQQHQRLYRTEGSDTCNDRNIVFLYSFDKRAGRCPVCTIHRINTSASTGEPDIRENRFNKPHFARHGISPGLAYVMRRAAPAILTKSPPVLVVIVLCFGRSRTIINR